MLIVDFHSSMSHLRIYSGGFFTRRFSPKRETSKRALFIYCLFLAGLAIGRRSHAFYSLNQSLLRLAPLHDANQH